MAISDKKLVANREKYYLELAAAPLDSKLEELFNITQIPNNSEWTFKYLTWRETCKSDSCEHLVCSHLDRIIDLYKKEFLNRDQFDDFIVPMYKSLTDSRTRGYFIGLVARKCLIEHLESEALDAFIRLVSFNEDVVKGTHKIKTGSGMIVLDNLLDGYCFKYRDRRFELAGWNAYITKSMGMESDALELFDKFDLNYSAAESILRKHLGTKTRIADDFTGFYPQIDRFLTKSSDYLKQVYKGKRQRQNQDNISDFLNASTFRSFWIRNTEPERVITQYFEYFALLHRYPKLFNSESRFSFLPNMAEIIHIESEEPRFKQLKTLYNLGVDNLRSNLKVVFGDIPDVEEENLSSIGLEF